MNHTLHEINVLVKTAQMTRRRTYSWTGAAAPVKATLVGVDGKARDMTPQEINAARDEAKRMIEESFAQRRPRNHTPNPAPAPAPAPVPEPAPAPAPVPNWNNDVPQNKPEVRVNNTIF